MHEFFSSLFLHFNLSQIQSLLTIWLWLSRSHLNFLIATSKQNIFSKIICTFIGNLLLQIMHDLCKKDCLFHICLPKLGTQNIMFLTFWSDQLFYVFYLKRKRIMKNIKVRFTYIRGHLFIIFLNGFNFLSDFRHMNSGLDTELFGSFSVLFSSSIQWYW